MKRRLCAAVLLCAFAMTGFSQSVNSTIGGTVQDASGAFIPGVTITATNTATGIASTTVSNESGVYNFASLQPGLYNITAELPGFSTQNVKDYQLASSLQARINFTLQVAGAAGTTIDVSVAADALLTTSSNSVGTVLAEYKVRDLPVQSRNVFDLVRTTPGVMGQGTQTGIMAGGRLSDVNATRDGVNVNDGRYENGAWSVVYSSPDLIEEVKVVVAPVDAETARGSGQVSMVTRSGGNQFRGSVFWANHNSALDANSWFNNLNGVGKSYDNRNQFGGRIGGPIIKNKTFFFALFEGQRDLKRTEATGLTYTDMAKAGIFRYFPGVDPNNATNPNPSVDRFGNSVRPNGATGDLAAIDLFGNCTFKGQPVSNCRTFRDPLRTAVSTHPYILEALKRMPSPNEFTGSTGDGLNTANIRFTRRQEGLDETNGNGDEVNRDQYNARIDHNFNSAHKISLIGTHEKTWGTATQSGLRAWPDGFDGLAVKRPYLYTIQFTSTLSNSLLNQVRASKRASNNWQWGSANRGDALGAEIRQLHATANGIPYQVTMAGGIPNFSNIGGFGRWREGINPMRSIADDLSWTTGKHSFKMGVEWRRQESNGFNDPDYTPRAALGAGANPVAGLDGAAFTGLTATAATTARNIIYNLSGSVSTINQGFGVISAADTRLQSTPVIPNNRNWNYQTEMMAFFKDDWKFSRSLTLNLGVHWEYYGQPYEHDGLAARVVGGEDSFYNVRCTGDPGNLNFRSTCTNLVEVQFVGKNSTNPDIGTNLRGNDLNNFAPSVGFSWSLPWFGRDKTVVRGGYGMNFEGALRNFITVQSTIGTVPGINLVSGGNGLQYSPPSVLPLTAVSLPIPFPAGTPTTAPFPIPTTARSLGISTYDRRDPYTQNWNFEIQREIAANTTVEARYIGSMGKKRWDNIDLNQIDGLGRNRALFDAFLEVRNGGESALLNQMFMGLNFGGRVVNGTTWTAAQALRTQTNTRAALANGEAGTFINLFNTTLIGGDRGGILRRSGFPENYIVPSPQYSTVNMSGNNTNSKYHALQLQVSRRLIAGFTNTSSFTWSKAQSPGATIDPSRRWQEGQLSASDRKAQFVSNGTWELPFGIGKSLLGNAPGWVNQIVSKWQLGGILNLTSGAPISFESSLETITTEDAKPNIVGDLPKNMGKVKKVDNGVIYFDGYTWKPDPTFTPTTAQDMNTAYANRAIVAPNGQIVLVNPQPGQVGTLGYTTHRGPGDVRFDVNIVKRFQIRESKTFEFRLDAINVLNKPNWGNPETDINNNDFGQITTATGARRFVVNARVNF